MRPIKLSMTAFGPYKQVEVIDFRELNDHRLFLITGPTGAGKTTIFDAISFAMYGEASGNLRSADSLRSHFSDDQVLTEVALEFELKGRRYHIHRIPRQNKPKARGDGSTEQKADATLTIHSLASGDASDVIIAGVKAVNEKVEAILGINAEQFRQIMMIPQGEFQKLLTASTEERERVLQQLFDTGLYYSIQQRLDIRAKNLAAEIRRGRELRDHELSRLDCPDQEELAVLIAAEDKQVDRIVALTMLQLDQDQEAIRQLAATINAHQENIEQQISGREKARENNAKLVLKESTVIKLTDMEQAATEINQLEQRVEQAEHASVIIPIEDNYMLRKSELTDKQREADLVTAEIRQAEAIAEAAATVYQSETSPDRSSQREQIAAELTRLRSYTDKVMRIETVRQALAGQEDLCRQLEREQRVTTAGIAGAAKTIEELRLKLETARNAALQAAVQREALSRARDTGRKLGRLLQVQSDSLKEQAKRQSDQKLANQLLVQLESAASQYKKSKLAALMNQAALLAKDLKENEACPVCGSTHHVALAQFSGQAVSTDELSQLEAAIKKLEAEYHAKSTDLAILEERLAKLAADESELLDELAEWPDLPANKVTATDRCSSADPLAVTQKILATNSAELQLMEKELTSLEQAARGGEGFAADIARLTEEIKAATAKQAELTAQLLKANNGLSEQKAALAHIFSDVPEAIRTNASLTAAISTQESLQRESTEKLERARQIHEAAKANLLALQAKQGQLARDLAAATDSLERAWQTLNARISDSGFAGFDDYIQAKLPKETIQLHKNRIGQHAKELHSLRQQLAELEKQSADLQPMDIASFDTRIEALRAEIVHCNQLRADISNRCANNNAILDEVEKIAVSVGDKESVYKIVGNLAKVARGENPARLTFERYVLAAFLEDIISAANIRLNLMTSGRYRLSRTEELQRSNAKGGLELEVYDNYTGKSRHVKTLSGGESFKASLAMALGLADVVQSHAGGVQLDTMFIDEGFGTLDQESLDSAINCLMDLQKTGRLVGIISHVQELKERLNSRLEVSGGSAGSTTRFVIG